MELLRWMGRTFAKFVGLVIMILGAWVVIINIGEAFRSTGVYQGWILLWILGSGLAGAVGGLFYLVSFDGPQRFRTTRTRLLSWLGMLGGALIPSMILPMLVVLVLAVSPTLFTAPDRGIDDSAGVKDG